MPTTGLDQSWELGTQSRVPTSVARTQSSEPTSPPPRVCSRRELSQASNRHTQHWIQAPHPESEPLGPTPAPSKILQKTVTSSVFRKNE